MACALALAGGLALTSCSASGVVKKATGHSSSATAVATTQATIVALTGRLDDAGRKQLTEAVTKVVDHYLDAAYLGDFPRTDFGAAFSDFTEGARSRAKGDLDLLTSTALSARIDEADATSRQVRLDILSPKNAPAGVTATYTLAFTTRGELDSTQTVSGSLDLTPEAGTWKVFGYTATAGPAAPPTSPAATPTAEVSP